MYILYASPCWHLHGLTGRHVNQFQSRGKSESIVAMPSVCYLLFAILIQSVPVVNTPGLWFTSN